MIILRELACAKINLYLHVTGRRADGYHLLDSLVAFADVADKLEAAPADDITLRLEGPGAPAIDAVENSVLRAAHGLRALTGAQMGASLTLHKHLPVAAGLGGGSADAAAALRLLMRLWNVHPEPAALAALALSLGADVPACLYMQPLYMSGIGEHIQKGPDLLKMPMLLVNPGSPLKTPEVFAGFRPPFSSVARHPEAFASASACVGFLGRCRNDLEAPATALMPAIKTVIDTLQGQEGCMLARMSGSGATCFGLFESMETAQRAARAIAAGHSAWWVNAGVLQ